jgi:polysaccharide export outer membrane protein
VSVLGAVGNPGVHQLKGKRTLIEVLSLAGGLRADAGRHVHISRRLESGAIPLAAAGLDASGRYSLVHISLQRLLTARDPEENILICPNDVITVPRAESVYVVGDVARQGALPLNDSETLSVLEAVAMAGGLNRTAAPDKAKILRPILGGPQRAELSVRVKQILAGKATDVPLLPNDILWIPDSTGKRIGLRAAEAAVQTGSIMATWGIVR